MGRSDGGGKIWFYNEEWTASIWPLLVDYAAPRILHHSFASANEVFDRTSHIPAGTSWREEEWRLQFGTGRREVRASRWPSISAAGPDGNTVRCFDWHSEFRHTVD